MAFAAKNTLFVRNLSPQVSETTLREIFGQLDVIEKITFKAYPNSNNQFFAQIDFKTSQGVTEGSKLSGSPILGVPCMCGVIDPLTQSVSGLVHMPAVLGGPQPLDPVLYGSSVLDPQGVQADYYKRQKEEAEDQRFRTVHVGNLPQDATKEGVRTLCSNFGQVENLRLGMDAHGMPYGLVQFKERGPAHICKMQREYMVDGRVLIFTESRTMVDDCSFAEKSVHFEMPTFDAMHMKQVLLQQGELSEKLEKVRAAAMQLFSPLDEQSDEDNNADRATRATMPEATQDDGEGPGTNSEKPPDKVEVKKKKKHKKQKHKEKNPTKSADKKRNKEVKKKKKKKKKKRKTRDDSAKSDSQSEEAKDNDEDRAINLDDDDEVAVVPNTELLVLGSGSSSSSSSEASMTPPQSIAASPARSVAESCDSDICAADIGIDDGCCMVTGSATKGSNLVLDVS